MKITRKHLFNIVFWIILIVFMGVKSLQHTIVVHEQGVDRSIRNYTIQAQSRLGQLNDIVLSIGNKNVESTTLKSLYLAAKNETNPYQYIKKNDELTMYIDNYVDKFNLTDEQEFQLRVMQQYLKQESLSYNAHAKSFNNLINRFPYTLVSGGYSELLITNLNYKDGVIVDR